MGFTKINDGDIPTGAEWTGNWVEIAKAIAVSNFKVLQSNNIFENSDGVFVEEFVDADGTNNTVNTGTTTASFSVDKYVLASTFSVLTSLTIPTSGFSQNYNTAVTLTGTVAQECYISQVNARANNSVGWSGTVNIKNSGGTTIASKSGSGTAGQVVTFNFTADDYSELLAIGNYSIQWTVSSGGFYRWSNTSSTSDAYASINGYSMTTGTDPEAVFAQATGYESSSIVVLDTNTATLDGTEKGLVIWSKKTVPANTSITYDISDGNPDTGTGDGTNDTTTTSLENEFSDSTTASQGIIVQTKEDLIFKSVTKHSSCTATRCRVRLDGSTTYYEATFSGDIATFTEDIFVSSGTSLYIECDNNGSSFTRVYDIYNTGSHTYTFPITGTYLDITNGSSNASTITTQMYNIASIVTQSATSNYDHTIQNQTEGSYIDISSLSSGTLKVTQNLATTNSSVTPESYGISGVILY